MKPWQVVFLPFLVMSTAVQCVTSLQERLTDAISGNILKPMENNFDPRDDINQTVAKFSLRKASRPDDDLCYIVPGRPDTLAGCMFNGTSKTFLVIHGWTLTGLFENWVGKLVSALYTREQAANVIVVDWLSSALNLYAVAAQNTEAVGQEVARFIDWIEDTTDMPHGNVHLIGYSLGAHVAGFAGSHANNKVGRITGLDPAGPDFEGTHTHRRLSPDDAHFVDALHTFTHEILGFSIGIQQPVGHVDIYPNSGSFQPGCNFWGALKEITVLGTFDQEFYTLPSLAKRYRTVKCLLEQVMGVPSASAFSRALTCQHERSVHLFIDTLLNEQEAAQAYRCGSSDMFNRGMCLSCRKSRCNTVGYGVSEVRKARNVQMYMKTRASMPFRVYHYQLKIRFSSKESRSGMEPSLTVSLYGTRGEAENVKLQLKEKIATNKTHSFLLVTEKDVGDLSMLKFKWEETQGWLKWFVSVLTRNSGSADVEVRKVRVRAGETQRKTVLCVKDAESQKLTQEVTFVRCKDTWRTNSKSKRIIMEKH